MPPLHIESISPSAFSAALYRYPDAAPSALADLDTSRYKAIPSKFGKLKKDASLQKIDVEKLVEWKLKHGTYRPALIQLVKSNSADLIKSTTQEAFASFSNDKDVMRALKILTRLRGVGPATASLLLSVYSPDVVPFFSDELFRWTHWNENGRTGWRRSIKYNVTEYKEVLASVEDLRKRLGVAAVDCEKVAYVLGKGNVNIDEESEKDARSEVDGKTIFVGKTGVAEAKSEKVQDSEKTAEHSITGTASKNRGTKRKTEDTKAPAEATRRSTRRKL